MADDLVPFATEHLQACWIAIDETAVKHQEQAVLTMLEKDAVAQLALHGGEFGLLEFIDVGVDADHPGSALLAAPLDDFPD